MGGQTADVRGSADFSKERCDFLLKDDKQTSDVRCSAEKNGFYLSPAFCAHNKVCIVENGAKVVIGMCDVSDQELIKRIRRVFDISEFGEKELEFVKISEEQCCRSVGRILAEEDCMGSVSDDEPSLVQTEIAGSPAVSILDSVMMEALSSNVSDIHFEPVVAEDGKKSLSIRFRKDGELFLYKSVDFSLLEPVFVRIKMLAGLKTEENRRPQDGRFLWRNSNFSSDVRVSVIPLWNGESAVLRLLKTAASPVNLLELGFSDCHISDFNKILSLRNSLVLVAGPTGAGKTTTIAGMVSRLASERRKIITIEDPVEYRIPGVTQIEVKPGIHFDFDDALRHVFRHDPDVLMIGEIRDAQTAATAVRAAVTGHLVLATVHASSACAAVIRLLDMGVEPYILASVFGAAVAQRLVSAASGGRTVVAEVLRGTEEIRRLIASKPTASEMALCMRMQGMISMQEDFEFKKAVGVIAETEEFYA